MVIKIHICIFLQNTHPNPELNLKVGGVSNQILQLISSYEKIEDVKISVVTKYSEYVPKTNKIEMTFLTCSRCVMTFSSEPSKPKALKSGYHVVS